jgi:hypothetical protein
MTESIFADIIKNYQYSSQHARMKAEQREKRYQQEEKEAEKSYLNNYKDLVPYSGCFIYGALKKRSIEDLVSSVDYDSRTAVYLAVEKEVEALQNKGLKFLEGKNAVGQKFWTSDVGLVFQIHSKLKYSFEEVEGVRMPSLDWAIQSIVAREFMSVLPVDMMRKHLYELDYEANKAATELKRIEYTQKREKGLNATLEMLGVEASDVNRQLLEFAQSFDHTYDFSDDGLFCMRYRAMEARFYELAKAQAPQLVTFLDNAKKEFWAKTRNQ